MREAIPGKNGSKKLAEEKEINRKSVYINLVIYESRRLDLLRTTVRESVLSHVMFSQP